jgi:hypothetical protein
LTPHQLLDGIDPFPHFDGKKPVVNFLFIGQKLGMRTFDSNVVFNILSSG